MAISVLLHILHIFVKFICVYCSVVDPDPFLGLLNSDPSIVYHKICEKP
jgi:hypothetical protein